MDSILSVKDQNFSGDGEEFNKVSRAVRKAESHSHWQFIGIWEALWNLSWNHRFSTPHSSETNGIAERAVRRVKEGTSAVLLQSGLDETWWADSVECYCYLRNIQDLLADGKTPCEKRFGEPSEGPGGNGWTLSDFCTRPVKAPSIWQESFTWNIPRICVDCGGLWKGDTLIADIEELEKMDASEIYPRRINVKEVWISQNGENSIFPIADGTAKVSGRDHEFREPTPRREQLVGSQDLRGELQGESAGPQPTGSKDDAEARKDFLSIQGDFMYRHHIEPRVQLHVPKEETFTIPLKCIDVTRATHTNLDVLQETRIDDHWNVDANRSLSDSWNGFTKFTLLTEKPPKGFLCLGGDWQKFKQLPDLRMCGLKYGLKLEKPLKRENSKNGQSRIQNPMTVEGWEALISSIQKMVNIRKTHQKREEKVGSSNGAAMPCKKRTKKRSSFQETETKREEPTRFKKQSMHVSWRLMSPRDNVWNHFYRKIMKITSQAKEIMIAWLPDCDAQAADPVSAYT